MVAELLTKIKEVLQRGGPSGSNLCLTKAVTSILLGDRYLACLPLTNRDAGHEIRDGIGAWHVHIQLEDTAG